MASGRSKKKAMSAREHDAAFRAGMKRIDANLKQTGVYLKRIDERSKEMESLLRELRKIADE